MPRQTHTTRLLYLILLLTLALTACGGSDSDDTAARDVQTFATATPPPTSNAPVPTEDATANQLTNNYARLDGAIAVGYPVGWVVDSDGTAENGTLTLGNNRAAQRGTIDDAGDLQLVVRWGAATEYGVADGETTFAPDAILRDWLDLQGTAASPQGLLRIQAAGDSEAASFATEADGIQRRTVMISINGGVAMLAEAQFIGDLDPLLNELLLSLRYNGPTYAVEVVRGFLEPLAQMQYADFMRVRGAQFFDGGQRFITWADDGGARIYDPVDGRELWLLQHAARISQVAFNADESQVWTLAESEPVQVWDVATGDLLQAFDNPVGRITQFALSPDEQLLAGVVINNQIYSVSIWDVASGALQDTFRPVSGTDLTDIIWNNASSRLLLAGSSAQARVFGIESGERELIVQHTGDVSTGFWTADDTRLISVSRDETIAVWDDATTGRLFELMLPGTPLGARLNAAGSQLVVWQTDRFGHVWDLETQTELFRFETPPALGGAVWFDDEQQMLSWTRSAANNASVHIVDAVTGDTRLFLEDSRAIGADALPADGSSILTFDDAVATLRALPSGEVLFEMQHDDLRGATLSPDGRYIVTWDNVGFVQLFDVVATSEE